MHELLASSLRLSTPLILAAMGGLLCERSGVVVLCLEGVMLVGAFAAAAVNFYSHSPWEALIVAMWAGAFLMLAHGALCIWAKADHIISGVAINIFAAGLTPVLCKYYYGSPTNSPSIPAEERFAEITVPYLSEIPGFELFFSQVPPLLFFAWIIPFVLYFLFTRTAWGIRLTACGEGPQTLRTAGVSPEKMRYVALLFGGALAGIGGAYLSIVHGSQFTRDMIAGRGFIAITSVIFGKWRPIPTFLACLLFGFADALQIKLQSATIGGLVIPVQMIQALPYIITLLVLAGFVGRAHPPAALGKIEANER